MIKLLTSLVVSFFLLSLAPLAAEPARADRSLWPESLQSEAGFNRASRAEILLFAKALAETRKWDQAAWAAHVRGKSISHDSIARVEGLLWKRLVENYQRASVSCPPNDPFCPPARSEEQLRRAAEGFVLAAGSPYLPWSSQALTFHRAYRDELLRLAGLFPQINSEIDVLGPQEITGGDFPDRQFFLTFDDGPTAATGHTRKTLDMLRKAGREATFFVLGASLDSQAKARGKPALTEDYRGFCVGMHGWEHKAHTDRQWPEWQRSVHDNTRLVQTLLPGNYVPLFRPPYGQRAANSGERFQQEGVTVTLWNIDSQDWSNSVSDQQAGERVLTLMLLWRRGIVLFHDIHPKAQTAVPYLLAQTEGSGVEWPSCRQLQGRHLGAK